MGKGRIERSGDKKDENFDERRRERCVRGREADHFERGLQQGFSIPFWVLVNFKKRTIDFPKEYIANH